MAATDDQSVSAGNLRAVVERLTGAGSIADLIYPVGAVYLSASATDPATLFGGTWERIQDRFLLCAGTTYAAGSEGGEASHTLTVDEMPSHGHTETYNPASEGTFARSGGAIVALAGTRQKYTGYSGGGAAHNNMPPYLAVYAWQRVA